MLADRGGRHATREIDAARDASHCGTCSNFCPIGASCNRGTCSGGGGNTSQRCGQTTRRLGNPLGCDFAWGANPGGAIPAYLGFASKWVGYEPNPTTRCDGCSWLASYGNLDVVPTHIAYFTAYHANLDAGLGDCNLDANGNLCSGGAQYIRDNRARLIAMYAAYAQRSYAAYPSRPVIWVIEPDASQYAEGQSGNPLTLDARIADGVVGALIYPEPGNYAQRIATLTPQLESTCR